MSKFLFFESEPILPFNHACLVTDQLRSKRPAHVSFFASRLAKDFDLLQLRFQSFEPLRPVLCFFSPIPLIIGKFFSVLIKLFAIALELLAIPVKCISRRLQ